MTDTQLFALARNGWRVMDPSEDSPLLWHAYRTFEGDREVAVAREAGEQSTLLITPVLSSSEEDQPVEPQFATDSPEDLVELLLSLG